MLLIISIYIDTFCVNEGDTCWRNQRLLLYRNLWWNVPQNLKKKPHYFLRVLHTEKMQKMRLGFPVVKPYCDTVASSRFRSGIGTLWHACSVVSPQVLCPVVYGMCLCRSSATKIVTPMRNCWDGSLMAWCVRESCIMTSMMPARWELTDNNNGDDDNNNNNNRHVFALHSSK